MVLTKQYLRYVPASTFGVIGSQKSCVKLVPSSEKRATVCAVGACEDVILWDQKTSQQIQTLRGRKHEVTTLCHSPTSQHLAVGYTDGTVNVFSLLSGSLAVTFKGHNSAVTALQYDHSGLRLASGAKDTNVVVWDIVSESGLYRLKGHKGEITQLRFIHTRDVLVSSSKDMLVKFWDMETQHCFKTLVGHRTEIYDFCVVKNEGRLITGSADSELRVYDITYLDTIYDFCVVRNEGRLITGSADSELRVYNITYLDTSEVKKEEDEDQEPTEKKVKADDTEMEDKPEDLVEELVEDNRILRCESAGSITRQGRGRVVSMATDPSHQFLACHGQDKMVEVCKILTDEELAKYVAKKTTKMKRKMKKDGETTTSEFIPTVTDEIPMLCRVDCGCKVGSVDLAFTKGQLQLCSLLTNNTLHHHTIDPTTKTSALTSSITQSAHRTDVRAVAFSSDNTALMSASSDSVKIWNSQGSGKKSAESKAMQTQNRQTELVDASSDEFLVKRIPVPLRKKDKFFSLHSFEPTISLPLNYTASSDRTTHMYKK